jgi:MFS family permease
MPQARVIWPLQSLNFFMADLQAGIGPFMGVFLLAHHWSSGPIGTVMTLGGVAGMVMTAPFGAMVDVTKRKRAFVVIPGVCAVFHSRVAAFLGGLHWLRWRARWPGLPSAQPSPE